ncbi:Na-translocating system protein MpsC family protein [Evansella sp. AB-P1]|uniref:Na-translocating system protein MpsC family protein n=1 Tax=Evansella sp. AB-P1 TaxID=3037653 RepID=UPI00241E2538|nr:Na-translocating system protein MpsC family protein [Evansella sp. AB-P1]MDG5787479.1 Na-translocating system protein MpsC family protein [Evansella sp. AB-P1]
MINQEKISYLSSFTSKLLRQKFGRGPESCSATLCKNHLVFYIRGFISPMEEVLLQKGQSSYVDHAREIIIQHVLNELKGAVEVTLDVEVEEYFHDWNFNNNSGTIILVLENELQTMYPKPQYDIVRLEDEVKRVTAIVQKLPDKVFTYPISENILLIQRIGILVPIEKALIAKGYEDELKLTKDDLEKSYFHRDVNFETIFPTPLLDLFIDWDFKEDKSMMCFILK